MLPQFRRQNAKMLVVLGVVLAPLGVAASVLLGRWGLAVVGILMAAAGGWCLGAGVRSPIRLKDGKLIIDRAWLAGRIPLEVIDGFDVVEGRRLGRPALQLLIASEDGERVEPSVSRSATPEGLAEMDELVADLEELLPARAS